MHEIRILRIGVDGMRLSIDEEINKQQKELERLKELKKLEENSLLRRTELALRMVGFTNWSTQTFNDLEIKEKTGWFGACIIIHIPIGYTLFGIVQDLLDYDLYVVNISTSNNEFTITITDKKIADYKHWQELET